MQTLSLSPPKTTLSSLYFRVILCLSQPCGCAACVLCPENVASRGICVYKTQSTSLHLRAHTNPNQIAVCEEYIIIIYY